MFEEEILEQLKALTSRLELYKYRQLSGLTEADERKFREQFSHELERFLTNSIVLLPPESSNIYCSKCGRRL